MNLIAILTIFVSTSFALQPDPANPPKQPIAKCNLGEPVERDGEITRVVDGDTAHVKTTSGTYSVRFLGIDTPETHFMGKSQGKWGELAAKKNAELLPIGARVQLEFGEEPCDSHGRVLAFIHKDNMNVNKELVKAGLAVNYCVAPTFQHCDEIGEEAKTAKKQKLGMFAESNVELPYDFRRRVQGKEQRSFVGNTKTKNVLPPGYQNSTPMEMRVFFYTQEQIKDPYRLVSPKQ